MIIVAFALPCNLSICIALRESRQNNKKDLFSKLFVKNYKSRSNADRGYVKNCIGKSLLKPPVVCSGVVSPPPLSPAN